MSLRFVAPTAIDYFAALVQSDEHFPLLEAAASLAMDEYPELDVQQVLGDVDQLLARLRRRLPEDASALQRLQVLGQLFYTELGFGQNLNDYYDPDNSYLHAVLRTRRGIPISLAVLWLELAQGLGLQAHGVGFPGHFMVTVLLPKGQVVIDPCTGESLSREALCDRLDFYRDQPPNHGYAAANLLLAPYLQVASPREIIARMLRNLKEVHHTQNDWQRCLAVHNRLVLLLPGVWSELRDRGLTHTELGQTALALQDLEQYLAHAHGAPDRAAVAERVARLRPTRR
jgi:regulator of sirC expression with transglutaminase-like and TPR domain